jgi:hypothetical protein
MKVSSDLPRCPAAPTRCKIGCRAARCGARRDNQQDITTAKALGSSRQHINRVSSSRDVIFYTMDPKRAFLEESYG